MRSHLWSHGRKLSLASVMMCVWVQCVAVCCSVLQCVAVCCSVLQCVAGVSYDVGLGVAVCCSVLQSVAVCRWRQL